ncbi:hypothetical protein ACT691_05950 [Vibrio metschnikovii]
MIGDNNQRINGLEYGYDAQAEAPWVWNHYREVVRLTIRARLKPKGLMFVN